MTLAAGQTLSFYEILGPLGAGAMGEVYRALDTRLGREVAIKVLPEHFADDDERLRRFEREAKTLASLNHSNVAGIHGIDQVDGTCLIVMELVPGEDLAARLARGPLPVVEAIDVCRQIAEGLEAAHEAGIVHRDLKPANVRITKEGVAKVLDFGLAKPIHPKTTREGTSAAESDSFLMTEEGLVLGTPTYMSPEQARGRQVDRRTDIWAFGCVLYECLTAKRAFDGETFTDLVAGILEREADYDALPTQTPPHVRALLERTLAKDPRLRLRDIGEARVLLERGATSPPADTATGSRGHRGTALAVGVLLGGLSVVAASWVRAGEPEAPRRSVALSIPALTANYSRPIDPRISPDGSSVIFRATAHEDDVESLWLRSLSSFEVRRLPRTEGGGSPFWSPDGESIGFFSEGMLRTMNLADGIPRALTEARTGRGTWAPNGVIVLAQPESGLSTILAAGGPLTPFSEPDTAEGEIAHHPPTLLPDGDRFLFHANARRSNGEDDHWLYVGSFSTGEVRRLVSFPSRPFYTDRGELIYVEDGIILSVPFDAEDLRITGEPRKLADGVYFFKTVGSSYLSVARDGSLAFQAPEGYDELMWVDRRGMELGRVGEAGIYGKARLSPDGRSVAVQVRDSHTARGAIQIIGLSRGTITRPTSGLFWESAPVWSADGRTLFHTIAKSGPPDIEAVDLASGETRPIWAGERSRVPVDVTGDGRHVVAWTSGGSVWLVAVDGSSERKLLAEKVGATTARLSPDEHWLAYASRRSGASEIYITELSGQRTIQISVEGGGWPVWDPREGEQRLYYIANRNQLWEVDLSTDAKRADPAPAIIFESGRVFGAFNVAPDAERFLLSYAPRNRPALSILLRGDE